MFLDNESAVMARIGAEDVVLDIGGWARCFNRANYVLDALDYDTRGQHYQKYLGLGAQGGEREYFTRETWIQRDICEHTPWPFADKSIDYCICSHTLEDIRDPIWVCHEINRVAKRGYIEVPSKFFEFCRDREPGVPVGLSHHAWIVDLRDSTFHFAAKSHYIHGDPKLSFPPSYWRSQPEERMFSALYWDDKFSYQLSALSAQNMADYVREQFPGLDDHLAELARPASIPAQPSEELEALRAELRSYQDLSPRLIQLAHSAQRMAGRHPRIASPIKRLLRKGMSAGSHTETH
jgi:hypothetical protein